MELSGELDRDFYKWLRENDNQVVPVFANETLYITCVLEYLPLSMQFALLCDFLETQKCYVELYYELTDLQYGYRINGLNNLSTKGYRYEDTKEEAITKAIWYLNENY